MISIRSAAIEDAATIALFNTEMAYETERVILNKEILLRGVEAIIRDPLKGLYFLAVMDGAVVGQTLVTYEWSDWRNGLWWWIQSVYVQPGYRKQGIYRSLHHHIEQEAHKAGCIGLRLYVEKENNTAQSAYVNMGMKESPYLIFEQKFSGS